MRDSFSLNHTYTVFVVVLFDVKTLILSLKLRKIRIYLLYFWFMWFLREKKKYDYFFNICDFLNTDQW